MNRLIKTIDADGIVIANMTYKTSRKVLTKSNSNDVDNNISTKYEYDNFYRLIKTTDVNGKSIEYEYYINDNVIQTKNEKGSITKYIYNLDKTVSRVIYAD